MKKNKKIPYGYIYLALIPFFAVIYTLLPDGYILYSQLPDSFLSNLYLSAITITTLGFGDITPLNEAAAVLIGAESVLGVVTAGLFLNQVAHREQLEEKKEEKDIEIARKRFRECDKLLQYAAVIRRIEDKKELEDAVRDFILQIDMHDYRILERICILYVSDGNERKFRESFDREVTRIEKEYRRLQDKTGGEYWG